MSEDVRESILFALDEAKAALMRAKERADSCGLRERAHKLGNIAQSIACQRSLIEQDFGFVSFVDLGKDCES